ncbi:MAG: cytochrome c biogenesis protein ResB, partial [Candidatus Nanopelagicales bacterium]
MAERTVDAPDDSSALGDEATTRSDDATAGLSTQPADSTTPGIKLGLGGWLRWAWRQLTSMRTALLLLFLLALASIPGSLLPQRSTDAAKVTQY